MDAKEKLLQAQEMAQMLGEKTQQNKLEWSLRSGGRDGDANSFSVMVGTYFYLIQQDKEVLTLEVRELGGPVLLHEEVSSEFGFDSPSQERLYSILKNLYDLVRRRTFDLDKKFEEARSALRKL